MKNNSFCHPSATSETFYSSKDPIHTSIKPSLSPSSLKPKSFLASFLNNSSNSNYKSPSQKSLSSTNRKNPLFYSISRETAPRDDEKFNEFKRSLLEELKVLKEANNLMRERNKGLLLASSQKPRNNENKWLREFFERRKRMRDSENGVGLAYENGSQVRIGSKTSPMIENTVIKARKPEKIEDNFAKERLKTKPEGLRNIYSDINDYKERSKNAGFDAVKEKLGFDLESFIRDLQEMADKPIDVPKEVFLKGYLSPNPNIRFLSESVQETGCQTEAEKKEKKEEKAPEFKEKEEDLTENNSIVSSCLSSLYTQAIDKAKQAGKKPKKRETNEKNADLSQNTQKTGVLITNSLNALYSKAVEHHSRKKKSAKCEKKVAASYLEGLYKDILDNSLKKEVNLGEIGFKEVNRLNRLDLVVRDTVNELEQNVLWMYWKARIKKDLD